MNKDNLIGVNKKTRFNLPEVQAAFSEAGIPVLASMICVL